MQSETSVRPGTITTAMAAILKQYRPGVGVSDALLLPCYVAATHTMTVQRALKQGAYWLVPRAVLETLARQEAGDKLSFINAALVSGFKGLKVTGSIQEALLQVTQGVFTPKIVNDYAKEAAKAATIEKHYSSQNNRLAAALADMHDALGQVKQDAVATADHFKNFQVTMNANLAQVQEKMSMQAAQLEAGELQLVQQQPRLTSQEAELQDSQTAFQEGVTAHSQMHSRLNGTTSGRFSFAAGAANPAPVDILINPLWRQGCALPSAPHIQAVQDIPPRDPCLVTMPLDIPNTRCW